jgi:redox-sensitive bicupin YhaK (pirin superfamily)
MIRVRTSEQRRHVRNSGRDTWMTFDPGNPEDPLRSGFPPLESFNEEGFAPGASILLHPQKDLEILTYVWKGSLSQEDHAGSTSVLEAGECGRSPAPRGASQRVFNGSLTEKAHAFQCGIASDPNGSRPRAEKKRFPLADRKGILRLIASPDGRNESLRLRQDLRVFSSLLDTGHHLIHELAPGRNAWLHVVSGRILLVDQPLRAGDGASLVEEAAVSLTAKEPSEILLFDLP